MAVDIFQMLIQILQISPQLVNEYSAQGPIYQLFYLFFFPMVFIVILVWMVMERFSKHRGLSILIGIAVLAFIILQGWYSFFAYLSRFWILIVVIIAAFMAFFSFRGKKEGGVTKTRAIAGILPSGGGFGREIMKVALKKVSGQIGDKIRLIEGNLDSLENMIKKYKHGTSAQKDEVAKAFSEIYTLTYNEIQALRQDITAAGFKIDPGSAKKFDHILKRWEKIADEWAKARGIDFKKGG